MSFHEVQFPTEISYGSTGGPGWDTSVIQLASGQEERVARLSAPRYRYNIIEGVKTQAQLYALIEFYVARQGPAFGFRYKDWSDYTTGTDGTGAVSDTDVEIGLGDASETDFQLVKKYTSGPTTLSRTITKPVVGTTVVSLDDVSQASGWTVNTATGVVTFTSPPGAGVSVKAGFQFDVPVRFGKELDSNLPVSLDFFEGGSIQDVPLVEIKDSGSVRAELPVEGSTIRTITADVQLALSDGGVQAFTTSTASLKIKLPDTSGGDIPGGARFTISNLSASSESLIVANFAETTLQTLAATGETAQIWYESVDDAWYSYKVTTS